MRILYVLKHDPWGIGGGCYACRNYLQLFSEVFGGAEMDVCICKEYLTPEREKDYPHIHFHPVGPRGVVSKIMTMFTGVMHRHQNIAEALLGQNQYDYCIFDHNSIAGSLVNVCIRKGVKAIVLNHNCEYDYFRDNNGTLKRWMFLHQVRKNESRSYLGCDYNIFLTEEDKEQFENMYGKSNTTAIVGGCFYSEGYAMPSPNKFKPFRKENMKMVISGTMGNVQNLDGINYFLDELLPHIPTGMQVVLAGKNPPASLVERVRPLAPRVTIIPNPKDMDAIVSDCDIFLCPARLGGGMKLRVMDGFRNGLPVLAHSVSARGYREFERRGMMWEFEDAEEFERNLGNAVDAIGKGLMTRESIAQEACRMFDFKQAVGRIKTIIK